MSVIDIPALAGAELLRDPYEHAVLTRSFTDDASARALREEFTAAGFTRHERRADTEGGKKYLMHNRTLVADGTPDPQGVAELSDTWQRLVGDVLSEEYRAALSALTGTGLDDCAVEARMTRYARACWIEPHTDRPDKAVTHLFYFNRAWRAEWNGDLHVLRGPRLADCARRVPPLLGTSVVLVRSDHSWHGVPPVAEDCPEDRLALLVHFVRP
ncbi:2OG-Fe(II) oxygenase [Kitasatospora sp. NPDC056446]|uniref:2OG-Fe(II) oxygenase n=1 Tax=Kitasatospora sp. NPDC056446 TaxID=3345819 RepID=UPI0036C04950